MEFAWGCQKGQKEGNGALEQHVLIVGMLFLVWFVYSFS